MRKRTDTPTPHRLRLREIHGHVTVTKDTATAWYVLGTQRWSFTTDAQREALIHAYAHRLVGLAGRRVRIRVTTRPYPAHEWAQTLHDNTTRPLEGWTEHLHTAQRALRASTLSDKVVFLGVDLPRRWSWTSSLVGGYSGVRWNVATAHADLRRIGDVVAGTGMDGRPATTREVEWLIHRSVRLGLPALSTVSPVDGEWDTDDLHAFTDGVHYTHGRFPATVQVTADYQGKAVTRHVAVLTVGRMGPLTIPQTSRDPWQQSTDRFDFPVEWSSVFDVLAGPEAARETERQRLAIRDMQRQYRVQDMDEPDGLERKAQHAKRIERETTEGTPVVAARAHGWHRIAVTGKDETETLRRVQEVIDHYGGEQIEVRHPRMIGDAAAQPMLLGEFIPGERVSTTAYKRRLPLRYVAAGLPHVSATVGDGRGPYMGYTAGSSRRAVTIDPHYAMEVAERGGLVPVIGEPGAGKSVVIGKKVYESVRRGITTTVLDPSGPLANLPYARHLDLTDGADGTLNPYAVIRDPVRGLYPDDDAYLDAVKIAQQERRMLARDVARMLLPPQVDAMPQTPLVLSNAIRAVDPRMDASLTQVVAALRGEGEHGDALAGYLADMAEMPMARLFFPRVDADAMREQYNDTLLVLTMHGLELPDVSAPREAWSVPEQLSVPLLSLASHYTTARAYRLTRSERKMIALDEAGMVGMWGSGRTLFTKLGRDSRKWNIAAIVGSQNPADVLGLNIANWISTSYVGRIEDEATAAEALRLLRIKPGEGYEAVLAGLSPWVRDHSRRGPREFIVRDVHGHVEKVRIDLAYQPELLAALDTTPGVPAEDWTTIRPLDSDRLATT